MFGRRSFAVAVVAAALVLPGVGAFAQSEGEFEVGAGYLSTGVRALVERHGWSLVWKAKEDRVVQFPFTINIPAGQPEEALEGALSELLEAYQGQFVADMYRGNRVVLIDVAPPNVSSVRPLDLPLVSASEGEATPPPTE